MIAISCYILTHNSEKYLSQVLTQAAKVAEEIVIVDSGSSDSTISIAKEFGCIVIHHQLNNFRDQRAFAISQCSNHMVLFFDSDEVPSDNLVADLKGLKQLSSLLDAYEIKREWLVLGKKVHVMFPIVCPDYPVRLLNRQKVSFDNRSRMVHETPYGHTSLGRIESALMHYSYETIDILNAKLDKYTTIAAKDIIERKKPANTFKMLTSPIFAWLKWYIIKGGWKDGITGWTLGKFAFNYTRLKYRKAINLNEKIVR